MSCCAAGPTRGPPRDEVRPLAAESDLLHGFRVKRRLRKRGSLCLRRWKKDAVIVAGSRYAANAWEDRKSRKEKGVAGGPQEID